MLSHFLRIERLVCVSEEGKYTVTLRISGNEVTKKFRYTNMHDLFNFVAQLLSDATGEEIEACPYGDVPYIWHGSKILAGYFDLVDLLSKPIGEDMICQIIMRLISLSVAKLRGERR